MPCITIVVPGLRTDDTQAIKGLEKSVKGIGAQVQELELKPDDFWVFIQTAYNKAPAIKVNIEAIESDKRTPSVMTSLAMNVGEEVIIWSRIHGYAAGVVVYTPPLQDKKNGFYEIEPPA